MLHNNHGVITLRAGVFTRLAPGHDGQVDASFDASYSASLCEGRDPSR